MTQASKTLIALCSLTVLCVPVIAGCSGGDIVRIDAKGTVKIEGQPVQGGTLVLTPRQNGEMPVASRIHEGQFAFDAQTGPTPGEYVARVKPDRATIEEISAAAAQNPRAAARQFHANGGSSRRRGVVSNLETIVVIGELPGQTIAIDL
ncbi:MAG: hypothetical protein ACF788_10000 [Novipirellula sp. JB048]